MAADDQHHEQDIGVLHEQLLAVINSHDASQEPDSGTGSLAMELITHANHLKGLLSIPSYSSFKTQLERELMWAYTALIWENMSAQDRASHLQSLSQSATRHISDNDLKS